MRSFQIQSVKLFIKTILTKSLLRIKGDLIAMHNLRNQIIIFQTNTYIKVTLVSYGMS